MDELSQLDLAFCVDLTTSMSPFLEAAKARMREILIPLRDSAAARLQVGLVGYRDYGTQVPLLEPYPFTEDVGGFEKVLGKLKAKSPAENRDAAEAVFAGLKACVEELAWRPYAHRVLVLVGDAPPHACGAERGTYPDRFPKEDPSGMTLLSMSAALETQLITVYALGMVPSVHREYDPALEHAFKTMAQGTGGSYRAARSTQDAMAVVEAIGRRVFGELQFDRQLWQELEQASPEHSTKRPPSTAVKADLASRLGASEHEVNAAIHRLKRRRLMESD